MAAWKRVLAAGICPSLAFSALLYHAASAETWSADSPMALLAAADGLHLQTPGPLLAIDVLFPGEVPAGRAE